MDPRPIGFLTKAKWMAFYLVHMVKGTVRHLRMMSKATPNWGDGWKLEVVYQGKFVSSEAVEDLEA
jgi:hypothetical protein